jgi:hypothetical protein
MRGKQIFLRVYLKNKKQKKIEILKFGEPHKALPRSNTPAKIRKRGSYLALVLCESSERDDMTYNFQRRKC